MPKNIFFTYLAKIIQKSFVINTCEKENAHLSEEEREDLFDEYWMNCPEYVPEDRFEVQEEYEAAKAEMEKTEEEIKILLIPRDPNDDKNVIVEIRGGAGGEESALFAGVLFRMYSMYAENRNWKIDIMNSNPTELGGYKEITFTVEGAGAYSRLKFESGVHRVQRVPETESQGRVHTSTATVAILPEMEDAEVEINEKDIRIVYLATGSECNARGAE